MRSSWPSVVVSILVSVALPHAAAPGTSAALEQGWHVVRPGDTLEGITARYLGSPREWKQNWKLNGWIRDPNLLLPGARLRVLLQPTLSEPAAQLKNLRRTVDEMPAPIAWKAASEDDLLIVRDGVRTDAGASAELAFTDGSSLRLAEDSLVFLGTSRTQASWKRDVEVVHGQADVSTSALAGDDDQVEIVLGPAVARARSASTPGRVRARRPLEAGAQVMVFEGSGDVAAAGSRVDLPAGTGSSVPEQGPPSPAEALLAAPVLELPENGASLAFGNPRFSWAAVGQAQSYLLEFCRDAACSDVVRKVRDVEEATWTSSDLQPGAYFWRVSARSASGLDGYASTAAAFNLNAGPADTVAPTVSLTIGGPEIARAAVRYLPATVPLEIKATDDLAGLASTQTVVNGQVIGAAQLRQPWRGGAYTVFVRGTDAAGNAFTTPEISFTVDDSPPAIEWQVTTSRMLRERGAPMLVVGKVLRDAARAARSAGSAFSLSADGGRWLSVDLSRSGPLWHGLSLEPQVFLLAVEGRPLGQGAPQLSSGQILWIRAADAGAGVASLDVSVDQTGSAGRELVITATDRVGNTAQSRWPLAAERR